MYLLTTFRVSDEILERANGAIEAEDVLDALDGLVYSFFNYYAAWDSAINSL